MEIKQSIIKQSEQHLEFVSKFLDGCQEELLEYWNYKNIYDSPIFYGELSFSPIIINALRKLTPVVLTEFKFYKDKKIIQPRYIDYYYLIDDSEYFMECKLLDLSKDKLFCLNETQKNSINNCFKQIKDITNEKLERSDVLDINTKRYKIALIFFRPDKDKYSSLECNASDSLKEKFKNIFNNDFDFEIVWKMSYIKEEIEDDDAKTYPFLAMGIKIEEVK